MLHLTSVIAFQPWCACRTGPPASFWGTPGSWRVRRAFTPMYTVAHYERTLPHSVISAYPLGWGCQ
eukprot:3730528-Amphidinium_carterae.1